MTRQRFKELARTRIPGWVLFAGSLLPLVAAVAGAARFVTSEMNATYVTQVTFATHEQNESAIHTRDSLIVSATVEAIMKDVASLVRACQNKKECP